MYIHEHADWPKFQWNLETISTLLINVRYQQGRLFGGMQAIGFHFTDEVHLQALTLDVIKSSEIEGEFFDNSLVRSSVARHLGMDIGALGPIDRNIEGIVEMTLDATQKFDQPLTKERLCNWHGAMFPIGRSGLRKILVGVWRTMHVDIVSGKPGKEIVHFEGPPASRVDDEMKRFFDWFNLETTLDPLVKAAIAHLWFVTIHPFEDGNGRISRVLTDMLLARSEKSAKRFYSISSQIQKERSDYYAFLEETQKGALEITPWITWFLSCLGRAIDHALVTLDTLLQKARFWESLGAISLNERQRKMINLMLENFEGKLTSSKWAKIAKCSQDTAYRDILDLIDRGILVKNPEGGRSASYSLANYTQTT